MYLVSNKWINDRHEGRQMGAVEVEDTTVFSSQTKTKKERAEEIGTRQAGFRKWQDKGKHQQWVRAPTAYFGLFSVTSNPFFFVPFHSNLIKH